MICVLLWGCSSNRGVSTPEAPQPASRPGTPTEPAPGPIPAPVPMAVIHVEDARAFHEEPPEASTPSLAGGIASAAIKDRVVGRQRNSFGEAMGNVVLANGATVTSMIGEGLAAELERAGYRVVAEADATGEEIDFNVRIRQFWAWFEPGFWSVALHARISTQIVVESQQPVTVEGQSDGSPAEANDAAWMEIVGKALEMYRNDAAAKLPPAH